MCYGPWCWGKEEGAVRGPVPYWYGAWADGERRYEWVVTDWEDRCARNEGGREEIQSYGTPPSERGSSLDLWHRRQRSSYTLITGLEQLDNEVCVGQIIRDRVKRLVERVVDLKDQLLQSTDEPFFIDYIQGNHWRLVGRFEVILDVQGNAMDDRDYRHRYSFLYRMIRDWIQLFRTVVRATLKDSAQQMERRGEMAT